MNQMASRTPTKTIVGTCNSKCPEYEMHEREIHLDLSDFEMVL